MTGEVLAFPGRQDRPKRTSPSLRQAPTLETFSYEEGLELLRVAKRTVSAARILINFIHANRALAGRAGIEIIGIEVVAIMEGDRFPRVIDAIVEGIERGKPVHMTTDGVAVLRTLEALLAEASSNVRRFGEFDDSSAVASLKDDLSIDKASDLDRASPAKEKAIGQAGQSQFPVWIPFIIFGTVSIVARTVLAIALSRRQHPYSPPTP